jgi:hypothetical protein
MSGSSIHALAYDWGRKAGNARKRGDDALYRHYLRSIVRRGDKTLAAEFDRGYRNVFTASRKAVV